MNDLMRSYRSLPTVPKVVVGGVAIVAALVLLVNLPHILGGLIALGAALIGFLFSVAVLVAIGAGIYFLVRAFATRR